MTIHDLSSTTDVDTPRHHELPTPTIEVSVWSDPVVDRLGHDPRSAYVERFWLPIMGPSTVWFLRRMADDLDRAPEGFTLDLAEMALGLGVGLRGGRNAPMLRTIDRSCRFGAARPHGPGAIAVRRHLAPLTRSQVERLPVRLQAEHGALLSRPRRSPDYPELLHRARTVALTMVEIGTPPEDTERQLHALRFHPAIAHDAVRWALDRGSNAETAASISR